MKKIKLLIPLVLSISILLPIQHTKSFNHKSDKTLVLQYKIQNEFYHKISYFNK
ncbi:MAG: hypothetical protein N4A68_06560 [Maledivibacter sp.]|jgi:hypothetical protein|nr:hypothetical protein [Maledivibacter sp.]